MEVPLDGLLPLVCLCFCPGSDILNCFCDFQERPNNINPRQRISKRWRQFVISWARNSEHVCVKHEQLGKLSFSSRFIVYVWTGENDAKKVWMDANLFWKGKKKVVFSNEYGYEWTEPKSHSFIHEPRKRQIPKLSRANCLTIQVTVRAWSHEPGKQCAWTVCYPLSCFLLGLFSGPPGKRDYLENCCPGTRYHNTGIPANRAGWVVI